MKLKSALLVIATLSIFNAFSQEKANNDEYKRLVRFFAENDLKISDENPFYLWSPTPTVPNSNGTYKIYDRQYVLNDKIDVEVRYSNTLIRTGRISHIMFPITNEGTTTIPPPTITNQNMNDSWRNTYGDIMYIVHFKDDLNNYPPVDIVSAAITTIKY